MAARDGLIRSTIDLIRCGGVAGTGLAEILAASGRSRRTVYLNFPDGKAELVTAATTAAGAAVTEAIGKLAAALTPRQTVEAFFAGWIAELESSDYRAGCPVMAAAMARSDAPSAADAAGEAFTDWVDAIARALTARGYDGERAAEFATVVVVAAEGAIAMAQATCSSAPLHRTRDAVLRLLD